MEFSCSAIVAGSETILQYVESKVKVKCKVVSVV